MNATAEIDREEVIETRHTPVRGIQPCGYLLELSPDWIVRRASENIHHLLGESHVTLIDEPLGKFVHSQALHDIRNLFSRLSGTTGIGRAYAIRLTDDPDLVDLSFQLADGHVLLEAVPSVGAFGETMGSIGGLIAGLANQRGQRLLDGGARRMRALVGYDRVTVRFGDQRAESTRGAFPAPADERATLAPLVTDMAAEPIAIFPRRDDERILQHALLASCDSVSRAAMRDQGVSASLSVRFDVGGTLGEFRCDNRTPRVANFETHAAAELFAQMFALRLEMDRLLPG